MKSSGWCVIEKKFDKKKNIASIAKIPNTIRFDTSDAKVWPTGSLQRRRC